MVVRAASDSTTSTTTSILVCEERSFRPAAFHFTGFESDGLDWLLFRQASAGWFVPKVGDDEACGPVCARMNHDTRIQCFICFIW